MLREKKNILELTRITPDDYAQLEKLPVVVVLDNVRSMHNVGAVFRTADAFKFEEIMLCGITGTPPHPDISKTALGAELSVRWRHFDDTKECVEMLRDKGYVICCLEQTHNSVSLADFTPLPDTRYAIVAGNEVSGVDQKVIDLCDTVIEIPQCGLKHSLNVSVSTGITMWHFFNALTGEKIKD